ncbi:epoxyqueuosine reductase, partial [Thermodesulfobacteriota bacterium]
MGQQNESSVWIEDIIKTFIDHSPENSLQNPDKEKAFDTPLVGFSSGNDPLYESYKDIVGPFHMTPWEIFALTFFDFDVKPEELTVISWILPQTRATKADN